MTNEPANNEPAAAEPANHEFATDEPAATEPSTTEPSATEPSATAPSATEPVPADAAAEAERLSPLGSTYDEPQDDIITPTPGSAAPDAAARAAAAAGGPTAVPPPGPGVPPPGGGASEPPPGYAPTGGYAAQYGLVRPVNGRYLAGVCGALGRATNTDPVLWRVLLPVLTVVGLLGGLIYLLGWLFFPSEGDSASPFEALIGRGHSSMSKGWTLILTILTAIVATGGFAIGRGGRVLLFAAIIAGAVLLVTSRDRRTGQPPRPPVQPPWAPPMNVPPAAGPWASGATSAPPAPWTTAPTSAEPLATPGYQAPFAPHGPYAPASPYPTAVFPTADTLGAPPPPPAVRPRPPRSTGPRRIVLSSALLAVGLLAALDVSNAVSVPAPAYFAVALAVLGIGMIVAAFFGRVRAPIGLGVILVIGLMISSLLSPFHGDYSSNTYEIRPATVADLGSSYRGTTGRMTVDLSNLDLSGSHTVSLHLNVGLIQVRVPRNVDVTVRSHVNVGATNAFGRQRGGIANGRFVVTDSGPDGPGGGTLEIDTDVNIGKVEVSR